MFGLEKVWKKATKSSSSSATQEPQCQEPSDEKMVVDDPYPTGQTSTDSDGTLQQLSPMSGTSRGLAAAQAQQRLWHQQYYGRGGSTVSVHGGGGWSGVSGATEYGTVSGSSGKRDTFGNYTKCKNNNVYLDNRTGRLLVLISVEYDITTMESLYGLVDAETGEAYSFGEDNKAKYLEDFGTVASVFKALNSKLQESK